LPGRWGGDGDTTKIRKTFSCRKLWGRTFGGEKSDCLGWRAKEKKQLDELEQQIRV